MKDSQTRPDKSIHVVLGAGQVGPRLAETLLASGHRVRMVRRGAIGESSDRLEWRRADLADPAAAVQACEGAAVIHDCTNPAHYGSWDQTLAPLRRSVREAAARTGAFLVSLDNGPGASTMSLYGERFLRGLARGRRAILLGDPDLPRSYSYVPDVAAGLATLGSRPDLAAGKVFHLPVAWKSGTTRELVGRMAAEIGVAPRALRVPRWAFRAVGLVSRDLGAVAEMIYQWEMPYVVDDTRFASTFGVSATPVDRAIRESVSAAGLRASHEDGRQAAAIRA